VPDAVEPDPDDEAVLLMTSGTTAEPKSAVLRHRHLVSYVLGSVEFGAADSGDAVIVSVPPYHIAAVANLLSNLYSGRRIVYLDRFTARGWLEIAPAEIEAVIEQMPASPRRPWRACPARSGASRSARSSC
jgi:acyl-CoA synthetase (AMP-forming)/AMP-acid ligase II